MKYHLGHIHHYFQQLGLAHQLINYVLIGDVDKQLESLRSSIRYPALLIDFDSVTYRKRERKPKTVQVYNGYFAVVIGTETDNYPRQQEILVETDIIIQQLQYWMMYGFDQVKKRKGIIFPEGMELNFLSKDRVCFGTADDQWGWAVNVSVELPLVCDDSKKNLSLKCCDIQACFTWISQPGKNEIELSIVDVEPMAVYTWYTSYDGCYTWTSLQEGETLIIDWKGCKSVTVRLCMETKQCKVWAQASITKHHQGLACGKSYPVIPVEAC